MCDYPAMYLTESGWMKNNETDCVDDVEDVLDFCRKVMNSTQVVLIEL